MTVGAVIDVFRVLAACTSLMMILSPMPTVYRIYKTHTTGHMSIFPLLAVAFNCHAWMLYGYLDGNMFPVFSTFAVGEAVSLVYVLTFYRWTAQRANANKLLASFGVVSLAAMVYALLGGYGYTGQSRDDVARFAGYIAIVAMLVLYSSPLEKVAKVFKHKSAVFIPIHMVIAGTINNAMWVVYTSLAHKCLMLVPNAIMLVVGVFQIIVFFCVYNPKSHPLKEDWKDQGATVSEGEEDLMPTPMDDDGDLESPTYVPIVTPKAVDETTAPNMQV